MRLQAKRLARNLVLAWAAGVPSICLAEIYGWVDGNGTFTYSNLPPPPEARVTDVIPEPTAAERASASAKAHEAQLAALNERVQLLELEKNRALALAAQRQSAPVYMPPPQPEAYGCGPDGSYDCAAYPEIVYAGVWGHRWRGWSNGWRQPLRSTQGPWRTGQGGTSGTVVAHSSHASR